MKKKLSSYLENMNEKDVRYQYLEPITKIIERIFYLYKFPEYLSKIKMDEDNVEMMSSHRKFDREISNMNIPSIPFMEETGQDDDQKLFIYDFCQRLKEQLQADTQIKSPENQQDK